MLERVGLIWVISAETMTRTNGVRQGLGGCIPAHGGNMHFISHGAIGEG